MNTSSNTINILPSFRVMIISSMKELNVKINGYSIQRIKNAMMKKFDLPKTQMIKSAFNKHFKMLVDQGRVLVKESHEGVTMYSLPRKLRRSSSKISTTLAKKLTYVKRPRKRLTLNSLRLSSNKRSKKGSISSSEVRSCNNAITGFTRRELRYSNMFLPNTIHKSSLVDLYNDATRFFNK